MRYYLTDGSGGYVGPFEAADVRARLQTGEVTADSLVCPEGGQQWLPASSFPELSVPSATAAPPPMTGAPAVSAAPRIQAVHTGAGLPQLSYVVPIIATILCCQIGGIISIIYTAVGNTALAQGRVEQYERYKSARNGWLIASVVIGVIATLAWVFMMIAMESSGY